MNSKYLKFKKYSSILTLTAVIVTTVFMISGCEQFSNILERVGKVRTQNEASGKSDNTSIDSSASSTETFSEVAKDTASASAKDGAGGMETSGSQGQQENPSGSEKSTDTTDGISKGNNSGQENGNEKIGAIDISRQRENFKNGIEAFEKNNYIIAEYYLNQVKDTYGILADHAIYYYAKSMLMQEKYDAAEENYLKLKTNYPDSIFNEKANLEYADLFYITQKYYSAETNYEQFISDFPESELLPYAKYQLAVCQEKNNKLQEAFENYKSVWLNFPASEYAGGAFTAIESLVEQDIIKPFTASNDELYKRGEIFFDLYWYESAIAEFNTILERAGSGSIDQSIYSKTLFKMGMSYYNLRDYAKSKEYLSLNYMKFPSGNLADDSLYYLGRVATNLDNDSNAEEQYKSLLAKFPQSNYADDALYRIGRIYFLKDDFGNARNYFQRIVSEYPGGDKVPDAYWELGMIEYKGSDYGSAFETFKGMAARFKGNQLGEKALFWQAKSAEKLENFSSAVSLYREIIKMQTYSYYTFAAQQSLEKRGLPEEIGKINSKADPGNPQAVEFLPDVYDSLENNNNGSESGAEKTAFSHVDKAKELLLIKFYNSADIEIDAASAQFENDTTGILQISTLYLKAKDYINSQKIVAKYYTKLLGSLEGPYKDYFYYMLYPYGYKEYIDKYSAQFDVDPLFVLAVIREESRFNPEAGSYAGAQGLMQIMPATGKSIANALDIKNYSADMLLDPETSIKMGVYYLSRQLGSFGGNKYYACGAYNGGPGAMNKWINNWGNRDIDEFIEYVSYDETRNYIKKVMGSYYFYQMLYR